MIIGSNWGIFAPNNADGSLNGLVPRYHTNPALVAEQFTAARKNGQTAVSIGIWFYDGAADGFAVDSTGGAPDAQSRANLAAIAELAQGLGCSGLMLRFAPEGANNASAWTEWQEAIYQTNWNFIIQCVLAVEAAAPRLSLWLDLHIEGIPRQGTNPQQVAYLKRLWSNIEVPSFWNRMPKTVSFIPEVGIAQQIPVIFDGQTLDFLAPDIYGPSIGEDQPPYRTAHDGFLAVINALRGSNHAHQPWFVTETFMNDWDNAAWFAQAIKETGITVLGVNQWPVTRASQAGINFDGQPVDATAYIQTLGGL